MKEVGEHQFHDAKFAQIDHSSTGKASCSRFDSENIVDHVEVHDESTKPMTPHEEAGTRAVQQPAHRHSEQCVEEKNVIRTCIGDHHHQESIQRPMISTHLNPASHAHLSSHDGESRQGDGETKSQYCPKGPQREAGMAPNAMTVPQATFSQFEADGSILY